MDEKVKEREVMKGRERENDRNMSERRKERERKS